MGLALAQSRLGPARLAHAMRWIGVAQRALDMAAERALEREAFGKRLAEHQAVQWMLADSALQLYAARLVVLTRHRRSSPVRTSARRLRS